MSAIYNIYKTIYFNSNKNSKKTIFSKSTNNKSYIRISFLPIIQNITLVNPKTCLTKKKLLNKNSSNQENVIEKMRFFNPIQGKNKKNKISNKRNFIICSPNNKSNYLRQKLIMTNNSNSNSINLSNLSKASMEQKIKHKIKNENKILINYKKENNKLTNLIDKQKVKIEKLKNKNKIYHKKLHLLKKEKINLNSRIDEYNNNQEQLILLIKIIQNFGVDIDKLIDDYNNSIDDYSFTINNNNIKNNDSLSEVDIKTESNSFIPINIEKKTQSIISKINIPKLNFEKLNIKNEKGYNKKIFSISK